MRFFDWLFPPRTDEDVLRDVSIDEFLSLVAPRLVPETRPGTVTLLPFSTKIVRAAIHEAKYHGSPHAFALLGAALAEYLRDADDVGPRRSHIRLVPVPLGKARRKERGFNQAEEVARAALRNLDEAFILDTTLLKRARETQSQVSLPREAREENMQGAFKATRPADSIDTYIVIDDVITTGATLGAAIEALQEAGAAHIIPLALAH